MATCDAYECKIFTPWRQTSTTCLTQVSNPHNGVFYKINDAAMVSEIAWFGTPSLYVNCHTLVLSDETDPDLQTTANDVVFAPGDVFGLSGSIRFQTTSARVTFAMTSYDALEPDDVSGATMQITFWAEPGREINPGFGCPDQFFGIEAENECQGPILVNCGVGPNEALLAGRDNGGYAGTPGPLDVDLNFTIFFDLNGPLQRLSYNGDFGNGYMEQLPYVNSDHPLPGEPFYCPHGTLHGDPEDTCEHAGHKLTIVITPGDGTTTGDHPAIILKGLVGGFTDCVPNPDFVDATDDQV